MPTRTNISRVLNIGGKNDKNNPRGEWTRATLTACAQAFDKNMGSSMPIPSQSMEINKNNNGSPANLFILDEVYEFIKDLAKIQYQVDKIRQKLGKDTRNINFYCTGFVLDSGDYIISGIHCPIADYVKSTGEYNGDLPMAIATATLPAGFHLESSSCMMDYLKDTEVGDRPHLAKNFALFGVSKSRLANQNTYRTFNNCFTLKEVADSIVPEFAPDRDISSGILAIPPVEEKTFTENDVTRVESISMSSLECLVTDYARNKDDTVKPLYLERITEAYTMKSKESISIGQTKQPDLLDEYIMNQ